MKFQTFTGDYVQRLRAGDLDTQRHFVAYFSDLLFIKLRKTLRCYQVAEDLRQETFLRVFSILKNKGGIDQPEKLGAFVYGVCGNVLAEYYRASTRYRAASLPLTEAASPGPDPETGLVEEERKFSVRRILATLPEKDRQILRLVFLEDKAKDEVCRLYNVDRNYLRVLLHRAKNRLRKGLAGSKAAARERAHARLSENPAFSRGLVTHALCD